MNSSLRYTIAFSLVGWLTTIASTLVSAQSFPTYSADAQSSSVPGSIDPGSILTPIGAGTIPPPASVISSALLGIIPVPGGLAELDALSYGTDPMLLNSALTQHDWTFSTDEFAVGRAGVPGPSVTTEGATGAQEAAADIYSSVQIPGPFFPYNGANIGVFDGNGGTTPFAAPGLNLREPSTPTPNNVDVGDNLDAWDIDQLVSPAVAGSAFNVPVYFSLDASFGDPLEVPLPYNTGTALANGFLGGDVLVSTFAGGVPALYAAAFQLGLDQFGQDTDDLDALVLWENGDGNFTSPTAPYSWTNGLDDMLLFSVRRGSAVIGQIDSLLGLPIEEGDILMPPPTPGAFPGIFVPAEALGLITVRTDGVVATYQALGYGDDLDGLDVQQRLIPEPATCALLLGGLLNTVLYRQRNRTGHQGRS